MAVKNHYFLFQHVMLSPIHQSLEPHHQLFHAQPPYVKEKLMETSNTTTMGNIYPTTSSNAQMD